MILPMSIKWVRYKSEKRSYRRRVKYEEAVLTQEDRKIEHEIKDNKNQFNTKVAIVVDSANILKTAASDTARRNELSCSTISPHWAPYFFWKS